MNTFIGPFRLMMREMRLTFYINVAITFVLFVFFNFLVFIDAAESVSFILFGPFFIVFLIYPFINFKGYNYILSLVGTRKQFVLAMSLSALIFSVASVALLNFLYYLCANIVGSTANLFHLGGLLNASNCLVYLWVVFSWFLFLLILGMFAKSFWFNFVLYYHFL